MPANCYAVPVGAESPAAGRTGGTAVLTGTSGSFNEACLLARREDAAALLPAPRMSLRRSHLIGASLLKVLARKSHLHFDVSSLIGIFFLTPISRRHFCHSLDQLPLRPLSQLPTASQTSPPLAPSSICPCRGRWQSVSLLLPSAVVLTV